MGILSFLKRKPKKTKVKLSMREQQELAIASKRFNYSAVERKDLVAKITPRQRLQLMRIISGYDDGK